MRAALPSMVLALVVATAGCSRDERDAPEASAVPQVAETRAPEPPPAQDLIVAPTFQRFVTKDYHWEINGYDVISLDADGAAVLVAAVGTTEKHGGEDVIVPVWYRLDWKATTDQLARLFLLLEETAFVDLPPHYEDRNIEDGLTVELILTHTAGDKRVTCANHFPPPVQALRQFMARELVGERRAQVRTGKKLTRKEAEAYWDAL